MLDNKKRAGRYTSSEIYRLMGTPAVRKTYITEKQMEVRLGKSLSAEFWSKATSWGKLMEVLAFNAISMEWNICSKETLLHPELGQFWSGTPDLKAEGKVAEVKGYEYKIFCQLTDVIMAKDLPALKKLNKGKEYWQIVSNAVILGVTKGAAVSFMPFEKDFEMIKVFLGQLDGTKPHELELHDECGWVMFKKPADVCLLPNDGYYNDLNVFEFDIPEEDIKILTERVKEDSKYLLDLKLVA